MAYPTDSPQRWAFDASADTADPGAFADVGFVADDPARYDWLNYTLENHGEWLTYLEDIAPSDGVLRFREWECPDDSAYDLRWSGSTDGLLEGTLDAMQIAVSDTSFVQYTSGSQASFWLTGSAGVQISTSLTGGTAQVYTADPTLSGDLAGLTIDADSGNVTLYSDYGSVEIPADTTTASTTYLQTVSPACAWAQPPSIASTITFDTTFPYVEIAGSTLAEVVGWIDIQGGTRRFNATDVIVALSVKHGAVTGSSGGTITFTLYRMLASGPSAVPGATLTLSQGDPADTTTIGIAPETIGGGESLYVAVSVNGTAVTAEIEVVECSYASTHLR